MSNRDISWMRLRSARAALVVLAIGAIGVAWAGCGSDDGGNGEDASRGAQEQIEKGIEEGKQGVEEGAQQAEEGLEQGKEEVEKGIEKGKQEAEEGIEKAEEEAERYIP